MRSLLASIFKSLFSLPFLRRFFYGLHTRVFLPFQLFKGVIKQSNYFGVAFKLHIDDWIQENIYFLNDYERAELTFLINKLQADDVFVDIGANIGLYSLVASQSLTSSGKVIAFEASQENHSRIQEHIELNESQNIVAHHLAVADRNKDITLYYDAEAANRGMVTAYSQKEEGSTEVVRAVSLDQFLTEERIDFIKLDIEGGEYEALLGMKKKLEKYKPTLLLEMEEDIIAQTNYSKQDMLDFLHTIGYQQFFISDTGDLISSNENPSRKNYVFLASS